jgi:hypothetical protein
MEGTACDFAGCRTRDFLPFTCELCKRSFCIDHRSRFVHNCNASQPSTARASNTGSHPAVSEMFTSVENRFDGTEIGTSGSSKSHLSVKSSAMPSDHRTEATSQKIAKLDNIARSSISSKDQNIASKTKQILLKKRAKGNDAIAYEDRFYIEVYFDQTRETRYMFFSCHASVGDVLRDIAKSSSILAFGSPVAPNGRTLAFFIADGGELESWQHWDRNRLLALTVPSFSVLHVINISTDDAIQAQALIQQPNTSGVEATVGSGTAMGGLPLPPSPAIAAPAPVPVPAPSPRREYHKGDRIVHTASDGIRSYGVVAAIHRDDVFPYYTVRIRTDGGPERERQTDAGHLELDAEKSCVAGGEGSVGAATLSDHVGETFSVKVSYKAKSHVVNGVPVDGTVNALKTVIAREVGVPAAKQKLIYKGKVLRNNAAKLRGNEFNIPEKAVIMLMME